MKTIRPLIGVALLALLAAVPAQAQRAHIGLRAGYNFDRERALVGGQLVLPLSQTVEFYPSVDVHTGPGSPVGLNLDFRVRSPFASAQWYAGGGLLLMRSTAGGTANTDAGGNIFAGLESRLGMVHPFVEVRGLLQDNSSVQLVGGLNFTIR